MTEILLAGLLLAHIVYHGWYVKHEGKERARLIRALKAKNLQEYEASEIIEQRADNPIEEELPDEQDMSDLNQSAFEEAINREVNG